MHIRAITKTHPAPAADIQSILDVITYILNIITQIVNLTDGIQTKNS